MSKVNLKKISKIINDSDEFILKKSNLLCEELTRNYTNLTNANPKELMVDFYSYCILIEKSSMYFEKYKKYSEDQIKLIIEQYNRLEENYFDCLKEKIDIEQIKIGYSRYREKLEKLLL